MGDADGQGRSLSDARCSYGTATRTAKGRTRQRAVFHCRQRDGTKGSPSVGVGTGAGCRVMFWWMIANFPPPTLSRLLGIFPRTTLSYKNHGFLVLVLSLSLLSKSSPYLQSRLRGLKALCSICFTQKTKHSRHHEFPVTVTDLHSRHPRLHSDPPCLNLLV